MRDDGMRTERVSKLTDDRLGASGRYSGKEKRPKKCWRCLTGAPLTKFKGVWLCESCKLEL